MALADPALITSPTFPAKTGLLLGALISYPGVWLLPPGYVFFRINPTCLQKTFPFENIFPLPLDHRLSAPLQSSSPAADQPRFRYFLPPFSLFFRH